MIYISHIVHRLSDKTKVHIGKSYIAIFGIHWLEKKMQRLSDVFWRLCDGIDRLLPYYREPEIQCRVCRSVFVNPRGAYKIVVHGHTRHAFFGGDENGWMISSRYANC
jgi:hypothetical protein